MGKVAILQRALAYCGQRPLLVYPLAVIVRLVYMPGVGHVFDLNLYMTWGRLVNEIGLFRIYTHTSSLLDYPPLYLAALGVIDTLTKVLGGWIGVPTTTLEIFLLKTLPVLGDLSILGVAYIWLRVNGAPNRVIWLITGVLAVHPGMIVDAAWWGQIDSLYTLLLILSLIAFEQEKLWVGWAFWAIGLIVKFQCVVLLPLLVVYTFKRQGAKRLVQGIGITFLILAASLSLFMVGSGWSEALRPYISTTNSYPYITVNAYNFWYAITIGQGNMRPDSQFLLGLVTYKNIGLAQLGIFTLAMCVMLWRRANNPQFFLWAGMMYFGFFMLPTEIHERYLYPAAVLIVLAGYQDRRSLVVGIALAVTFGLNLLPLTEPLPVLGWTIHSIDAVTTLGIALINVVLFLALAFVVRRPQMRPLVPG